MIASQLRQWVTLANSPQVTDDADGMYEPLSPAGVWAGIQPIGPADNGRSVQHLVTMRYHPQVSLETRIVYGTRHLFVRGIQNVDERNVELRLICDEAI